MASEQETVADIVANMREKSAEYDRLCREHQDFKEQVLMRDWWHNNVVTFRTIADRLEAARRREAEKIERIVRDAVVDYNGMYTCAPNDETEREVVERAETANEWLKSHGMEPEPFHFSKEEVPNA